MTYSAQFHPPKKLGDMFQSFNGDVWQVVRVWSAYYRVNGIAPEYATVERIAEYDPSWFAPRSPRPVCCYCGRGFTKRNPDISPVTRQYHWVCFNQAGYKDGLTSAELQTLEEQEKADARKLQEELARGIV